MESNNMNQFINDQPVFQTLDLGGVGHLQTRLSSESLNSCVSVTNILVLTPLSTLPPPALDT